jgi:oligopeptide/dipeptide ABC transporter ATP-binding protein
VSADAPLLALRDVTTTVRIGGKSVPVVEDVSLEVADGEIVGLVGESGSGKSMTARTIIALLPPGASRSGSVQFAGQELPRDERGLRQIRGRKIAMIFQDPRAHIDPLYRNSAHLIEGLRAYRGMSKVEARVEATRLLNSVGIVEAERVLSAYPWQVSGGMLQRVLIAGALTGDPDLLIADEPTTALDVTTQAEIAALFNDLRRDGRRGILFITHDLELAAVLCDRTIVMYAGRIMEEQSTAQLFDAPLHPYTAALLQARPRTDAATDILSVIPGQAVSAYEAPSGCPFHTRCAHVQQRCRDDRPSLQILDRDGGSSSCLRVDEVRAELSAAVADV